MYSLQWKYNKLKKFYLNTPINKVELRCPFGKDYGKETKLVSKVPCSELCGLWPELGDVQQGCPCQINGSLGMLVQLEKLLRKAGYINSIGEDI